MSWQPLVTRGFLTLDVLTARRALEDGLLGPSEFENVQSVHFEVDGERYNYMLRYTPDGSDPVMMLTKNAASVRTFINEMAPRTVQVLVGENEDEFAVNSVLRGEVH
jgi:hypothetical protein